jgi:hypothetical protein
MARNIDFLIIGTPKSGTTSLNDYLSQHPNIYLPRRKDDGMFITYLPAEHPEAFCLWYQDIRDETLIGGAEVNLMYFPDTAERVYRYNLRIPVISATQSSAKLPPNPVQSCHLIQCKAAIPPHRSEATQCWI